MHYEELINIKLNKMATLETQYKNYLRDGSGLVKKQGLSYEEWKLELGESLKSALDSIDNEDEEWMNAPMGEPPTIDPVIQKERDRLREGIQWRPFREKPPGGWGMVAGWPPGAFGARLIHEELEFEVACNSQRSQIANKEMCMTLFELFLMETIK